MKVTAESWLDVGRICNGPIVSVDADDMLLDAAEAMAYRRVGAVAVMEHGKLVGLISEADLVAAIAERASMDDTPVRDYMTEAPITVEVDDPPELAARYMLQHEIGHLPVLRSGAAIGMVSRGDLLAVGAIATPR